MNHSFLDYTKHNRNRFCGRYSIQKEVEFAGERCRHIARLSCKGWSCPICGPKKAYRLRKGITRIAVERNLCRLLTLTLDPKTCTPEESIQYLLEVWRKFRVYLIRKYGRSITFIAIRELQKSGYAHLHILIDRYVEWQWIQETWQALGGGKFVNIKRIDLHRIAAYLTKYLTKDLILAPFKPRTRRYSTSRDIRLFGKTEKGKWQIIRSPATYLLESFGNRVLVEFYDNDGVLIWFRILAPTEA